MQLLNFNIHLTDLNVCIDFSYKLNRKVINLLINGNWSDKFKPIKQITGRLVLKNLLRINVRTEINFHIRNFTKRKPRLKNKNYIHKNETTV